MGCIGGSRLRRCRAREQGILPLSARRVVLQGKWGRGVDGAMGDEQVREA